MESFVVSARKYRPLGFAEVVGQSHITTTLKNALDSNHLAQTLLFCGPRGVGKTTCARILARMVNDFEDSEANPLNIYELDAASNNSVDDIRDLIDQVRYPPQQGKYKVYIIDEVHMLSNAAFNAFLKTLEEPPKYAIFILATTEKHKVIPTILSRCQIFDFNRIQIEDITQHLKEIANKENVQAEDEALHLIAQKADGALRDALSIFDLIVAFSSGGDVTYKSTIENLHILDHDYYFKVTDKLHAKDISGSLLILDEILKNGFDGRHFLTGLSEHFRNILVCKDNATVQLMEVSDTAKQKYVEQANQLPASYLLTALNIANKFDLSYKDSKNQRLHVELALMKIAHVNDAIDHLTQTLSKEEGSKKKSEPASQTTQVTSVPDKESVNTMRYRPKKLVSLPKINELLKGDPVKIDEKKEEETSVSISTPIEKKANDFTVEALKSSWENYKQSHKDNENNFELVILNKEFELKNKSEIHLILSSDLELDRLKTLKHSLLAHLRNSLENDAIDIFAEVKQETGAKKAYTSADKFKVMMDKNPNLVELKNRLGLDPDI